MALWVCRRLTQHRSVPNPSFDGSLYVCMYNNISKQLIWCWQGLKMRVHTCEWVRVNILVLLFSFSIFNMLRVVLAVSVLMSAALAHPNIHFNPTYPPYNASCEVWWWRGSVFQRMKVNRHAVFIIMKSTWWMDGWMSGTFLRYAHSFSLLHYLLC